MGFMTGQQNDKQRSLNTRRLALGANAREDQFQLRRSAERGDLPGFLGKGLARGLAKKAASRQAAVTGAPTEFTPDPNNPQKTLAYVTDQLQKRKNDLFWPLEDRLIKSMNDRSLIGQAGTDAAQAADRMKGVTLRTLQRTGAQLTPAQQAAMAHMGKLDKSLQVADAQNNARLDVQERNDTIMNTLLNNSRALTGQSIDGLTTASSLQSQRKQAYDAAKTNYHNNKVGAAAGLISSGLMFFGLG